MKLIVIFSIVISSLCFGATREPISPETRDFFRTYDLQFYPKSVEFSLGGLMGMLSDACERPESQRYQFCLLENLLKVYFEKAPQFDRERAKYEWPPDTSENASIITGFFNERWLSDKSASEVRPVVEAVFLRIALFNEISRWQKNLALKHNFEMYRVKRLTLPQIKAYFGGLSPVSRVLNYADAIQCEFDNQPPKNFPKTQLIKECEDEKRTLTLIGNSIASDRRNELMRISSEITQLSGQHQYDENNSVSIALNLGQRFYKLYSNANASQRIFQFVTTTGDCGESRDKDLKGLCRDIEKSVRRAKDVQNLKLAKAVTVAATLAELAQVKIPSKAIQFCNPKNKRFDGFQNDVFDNLCGDMARSIQSISEIYEEYDPQNILRSEGIGQ